MNPVGFVVSEAVRSRRNPFRHRDGDAAPLSPPPSSFGGLAAGHALAASFSRGAQ